jgi:hypothetical protein
VVIAVAAPAAVTAATPSIVVDELQYNPADDNPNHEFIELHNTTGSNINLGG